MSLALGKEVVFAECRTEHSAKNLTWGPSQAGSLPNVPRSTRQKKALGKRWILCRVSRGTLGKAAVSDTRRRNGRFSLPSAVWHSAKIFAECPRKSSRQRRLCRCTVRRAFFAECFQGFAECFRHSAKRLIPVVSEEPMEQFEEEAGVPCHQISDAQAPFSLIQADSIPGHQTFCTCATVLPRPQEGAAFALNFFHEPW
jgi:hypothetical protein